MNAPLLSLKNLSIRFGTTEAVKNLSLDIQPGEMLALVGESGSGKSLTALSILKLLPESARMEGAIRFEGKDITGMRATELQPLRGGAIGMVFQEPMSALNPLHTIGRQISEALTLHGGDKARVPELLEAVGLAHFKTRLDAYPHQLSGGERQRVLIAIAIANNPKLLIADEPTTAVDVTVQAKLLALLKRLQKERGLSMLFITHDLTIVEKLADSVAVMRHGEIVERGAVKEVFSNPKHDYTKMLLGSAPKGRPEHAPASDPIIEAKHLRIAFPIQKGVLKRKVGETVAVESADFTIRKGETLGLVGESGSGKTTLSLALLKLLPSKGNIVYLGNDISAQSKKSFRPLRAKLQMVFQDPFGSLNPRMTIGQIITEGLSVHAPHLKQSERETRLDAILQEIGLAPEMKHRYPHEFSGGQRQRIAIARAMILNPDFVVLDEPTSALDLTVQSQIIALLQKFQAERGTSYLFISHDLRVIRASCHRILVMKQGKIVESGPADDIFERPEEAYTKELLNAAFLA